MKTLRFSRRDFAKTAAFAAAVAVLPPVPAAQETPTPPVKTEEPKQELSAASKAEAEGRYESILRRYGSRFSEAQKAELRRSVMNGQKGLDALRAYQLDNADEPATLLHLFVAGKEED